jgi:hypothetical protein
MPRALLPGGRWAEPAPRRDVVAVYHRTGNRERLAALLAALIKGLESAPGR